MKLCVIVVRPVARFTVFGEMYMISAVPLVTVFASAVPPPPAGENPPSETVMLSGEPPPLLMYNQTPLLPSWLAVIVSDAATAAAVQVAPAAVGVVEVSAAIPAHLHL